MNKIEEAQVILKSLGLPQSQQNEISALTLLALCGIKNEDSWEKASRRNLTVTKGIMDFISKHYGKQYAPNTRETVRRQVLHQFELARIIDKNPDNPNRPTNSPHTNYAITQPALNAIRKFGTDEWQIAAEEFIKNQGSLIEEYRKKRKNHMIPVSLPNGEKLELSPGQHNEVQAAIIEKFAPNFAPGSLVLYVGDTSNKSLHLDAEKLKQLGIPFTEHDKLPDVVLYDEKNNWLYLIEAVTSHGPISHKRKLELERMLHNCNAGIIYVTAFPDFTEFKKHIGEIAWETEVWVMEFPDHMIHYNGDRFIGPRYENNTT